jgi:hypothetical protein
VLRTVRATSYVTPLREGGSLPGLVEADDDGMYVAKFRGAGQGTAALVAEVVVGEIGRLLGIRVPELVLVELDPQIAKLEPDPEIQELLAVSAGLNLGMDYLPGSLGYDGIHWQPPAAQAATVRWLDAYAANIDRTWRNPNVLIWHRKLWAIDHGAALIFQHAWPAPQAWATRRYDLSEHVLGPVAETLDRPRFDAIDRELAGRLTPEALTDILGLVPDDWLLGMNAAFGDSRGADDWRARYLEYLLVRLEQREPWRIEVPR